MKPTPSSSDGPGLAGEDLDAVAQLDELAGHVPGVDALPTATGVAPVDEQGDPEPPGTGRGGDCGFRRWDVEAPLPRQPQVVPALPRVPTQAVSPGGGPRT